MRHQQTDGWTPLEDLSHANYANDHPLALTTTDATAHNKSRLHISQVILMCLSVNITSIAAAAQRPSGTEGALHVCLQGIDWN